jgi:hypothetical protein
MEAEEASVSYSQEPAIGPIVSQMNPIHKLSPFFLKIPSTSVSRKLSLPLKFPD